MTASDLDHIFETAWIVVRAFRESKVIRGVIENLRGICRHIVVVDDGSRDSTPDEALAGGAVVLRHAINLGQGAALRTGIDFALRQGAQYIFTYDADGQHAPESLAVLAAKMQETGADIVLGSRWLGEAENIPWLRRLILHAAVVFTRFETGLAVTDTHNGLRLLNRRAATEIRITQPRMAHASEILEEIGRQKLKYAEAPVTVRYTDYSLGKGQKVSGMFRVLLDLLYAHWTR